MVPAPIATLTLNPALDESTAVSKLEPHRKLRCAASTFHAGGGGINVARAVVELGGDAVAVFTSGGAPGAMLERLLSVEGVDFRAVPIRGSTRENLNVTEAASGRQFRFCRPGPELTRAEFEACVHQLDALPALEYLVLSGSLPPGAPADAWRIVAAKGRRRGARVLLDSSGESLKSGVGPDVFLVKSSASEFESLVGGCASDDTSRVVAARRLLARSRCRVVVLSLGFRGALWVTETEDDLVAAPVVPVVSAVGAGDSMLAGIVWSLYCGTGLGEAVSYGVAAGSAAVMNPGTELCHLDDVERLRSLPLAAPV